MTTALILDTETTGLDEPELIEAAWLALESESGELPKLASRPSFSFVEKYKPSKPITFGAMAVHHILPMDLEDCSPSSSFVLPDGVDYLVGHNIDFDWGVIGNPDIKRICTDAMARYVWPEADSYSQSALLYMLRGPTEKMRERLRGAHSALTDVENCFDLLQMILTHKADLHSWEDLYAYSEACRIPHVCPLGKWKGTPLKEVAEIDPGYCHWILRQDWVNEYLRAGVERALGHS